jgi:hypothetical protein
MTRQPSNRWMYQGQIRYHCHRHVTLVQQPYVDNPPPPRGVQTNAINMHVSQMNAMQCYLKGYIRYRFR